MSVGIKEERLACFLPQHPRLDTRRPAASGNNYIFLRFFLAVGFFAASCLPGTNKAVALRPKMVRR